MIGKAGRFTLAALAIIALGTPRREVGLARDPDGVDVAKLGKPLSELL